LAAMMRHSWWKLRLRYTTAELWRRYSCMFVFRLFIFFHIKLNY
jgi:hypothetical protein